MKKNYAAKLGALALVLTMMSTCLMGGTLAKYVTQVDGTATAKVAAWSFAAKDKSDTALTTKTPIDLGSTVNRTTYKTGDIMDGVIAPGTSGSFDIVIDGTGSEVGIDYTVALAATEKTVLPGNLKFEYKVDNGDLNDYTLGSTSIAGNIAYSATNAMKKTITVQWTWPIGDDTTASKDNDYQSEAWTINITATGKQMTPTVPTP